jgi:hypothetical protein
MPRRKLGWVQGEIRRCEAQLACAENEIVQWILSYTDEECPEHDVTVLDRLILLCKWEEELK